MPNSPTKSKEVKEKRQGGLVISYKLAKGYIPDKETIKVCDEAAKAFQSLLVNTAKITSNVPIWLMWFITRFYKRTITKESIDYWFYLIPV